MTRNISLSGFALTILILCTPLTTFGYYTTDQTVTKVTDQTALYSVTYNFGLANRDVYLPITTQRNLAFADTQDIQSVGYSFISSTNGTPTDGTAVGLILSDAPIVNNMYKIGAGHRANFTLFVVLTLDADDPKAKYALQVDKLPFIVESSDSSQEQRELNNYELSNYVTGKVGLNR